MDKDQKEANYQAWLNREGPRAVGTVKWPEAKQGALQGMKLRATGVMETVEREDLNRLVDGSSGKVMSGMSKNLDYLIVGRDAGPTKLQKAEEWGHTADGGKGVSRIPERQTGELRRTGRGSEKVGRHTAPLQVLVGAGERGDEQLGEREAEKAKK